MLFYLGSPNYRMIFEINTFNDANFRKAMFAYIKNQDCIVECADAICGLRTLQL